MNAKTQPIIYKNIPELSRQLGLPEPLHPLIALVKYDTTQLSRDYAGRSFLINFYKVSFKKKFRGQVKYGQGYYDFEEGGLAFLAPNQLVTMSADEQAYEGYTLYFHADLIRNYPLGKTIYQYGFFAYAVNEALFLSEKEKNVMVNLFDNIAIELDTNIDAFSQDVLVSQIELLLNQSNRFYNRQFLTRKVIHHDLISQMDTYLAGRFAEPLSSIPTVLEVAKHLQVSPRYLTDMLKSLTGQNAQQYIHNQLIEEAKFMLSTTRLRVAEVAYRLGFEHPQSFNKLFKSQTHTSPSEFRQSFN